MRKRSLLLFGAIAASLAICSYAVAVKVRTERARGLLLKMMAAEKETNYSATARISGRWKDRDYTFRVRIHHASSGRTAYEVLEGPAKSEKEEKRSHHHGRRKGRGGWGRRRWGAPIKDVDLVLENYDVSVEDGGSVAGRRCRRISIRARRPGRPSCSLWIDEERHLLLKYTADTRSFEFESVRFDAAHDESLFPPRRWSGRFGRAATDFEGARRTVSFPLARPAWLPEGFRPYKTFVRRRGDHESVQMLYTDGLAILSLFQSPPETGWGRSWSWLAKRGDTYRAGRVRRGNTTLLTVTLEGVTVTAVGTLPEEEWKNLLSSLVLPK